VATLHVRKVPDVLYELLRERAAIEGRSIGAEIVNVLEREFAGQRHAPWAAAFGSRRRGRRPFERFSPRARRVIVEAQEEARALGSPVIATEHLLLPLFAERYAVASSALAAAGLEGVRVRKDLQGRAAAPGRVPGLDEGMPFTSGAKQALELALRESIAGHCHAVEPWHLLLGIAREGEGLGAKLLLDAGQDADTLSRTIMGAVRAGAVELADEPIGFRVIELTGEAAEWEQQLNMLAAGGYALVEIVGNRAIFSLDRP
jgi:ATP-dependent Clp protease ATP-binding subunit ClpC